MASEKTKTQYQPSVSVLKHEILDDIMNICRVCLKVRKNMRKLFQSKNKLVEKIHFCTGIRITENAGLSSSICNNCESELTTAHKFKKKILKTYTYEVFKTLSGDDKCMVKVNRIVKNNSAVTAGAENDLYGAANGFDAIKNDDTNTDVDDMISDFKIEDSKNIITVDEDAESLLTVERDIVTEKRNIKHGKDTRTNKVLPATQSCMYCDKTFRTKLLLAAHKRECHKEQGHICDICGQTLKNHSSFNSHIRLHSAPQFSCSQCDYKTHTKKMLTASNLN